MKESTATFLGHRKIKKTEDLKKRLFEMIRELIVKLEVKTFLFGSKSEFDALCLDVVTELKEEYPDIKRIYVRAEFPYINDDYRNYLLQCYDDTYYPEKIENAGKAVYVERNCAMIDESDFCIVYYDENYAPPKRRSRQRELPDYQPKSGTKIAYDYAVKKGIKIFNVFNEEM